MTIWKATHWSLIAFALALASIEGIANASIQAQPALIFKYNQLVPTDEESASSNSSSLDNAVDRPDSSDELYLEELLRDPTKKFYPASGSSSSSSSTPTTGSSSMLATAAVHLPERDDRVQQLVYENSVFLPSEFVCRILRPPRAT
jgi:hypothetical protein